MTFIKGCFEQVDIVVLGLLFVMFMCKTTRNISLKALFVAVLVFIYSYFLTVWRDQEVVRILLNNFKPNQIIELLTTKVRFTSSKSMPDFKNVDLKKLLNAIVLRFLQVVSPIKEYVLFIKGIFIDFIKEITKHNELVLANK